MNAQQTAQVQAIFGDAIDLEEQDRAGFVVSACSGDDSVLREVQALLKSIERAGRFLSVPTSGADGKLLHVARQISSGVEQPGTRIGNYKLLELIGEGGFGSVFMADQEQPVRRKVALKIIKLGMDTKQVIARFEAERQALAMMDHPNIAQVFEAGATETGRPYFVMELVRGVPITEYCDTENLSPTKRLELFVQVCQAVQHAHQKGIIHRDLKPSNVLVTLHDDKAVPKVIDFGIAKATNARLTELTLFTEFRQFVGTPAYMSPEQAQFNDIDVDTRSDVYSLGVLLYELLTGTTPFHARELRAAGYERIGQLIREAEPPKPSTRLSAMKDLPAVASHRSTDSRRLSQMMRGELDWIVMKCLEKDRTRRYDAASALAADLKRHLADEPVLARPPSRAYSLLKLVRRNKRTAAAVGVALVGLVGGLAAASYGLTRATHERNLLAVAVAQRTEALDAANAAKLVALNEKASAERSADTARTTALQSEQISQFLQTMLTSAQPSKALGRQLLAREVIDGAAKRIDDRGTFDEQPRIEASIRDTLGQSYISLGEYEAADAQLRIALQQSQRADPGDSVLTATILADLSAAADGLWHFDDAIDLARESLVMQQRLKGDSSEAAAVAMESLASSLSYTDDDDDDGVEDSEIESLARNAIAIRQNLGQTDTEGIAFDLLLLSRNVKDEAEEESLLRQALAIEQKLLPALHPDLANTLEQLAHALANEEKFEDARVVAERSLAIRKTVLPSKHPLIADDLTLLRRVLDELHDWRALAPVLLDHYAWAVSTHHEDMALDDMEALEETYLALHNEEEASAWHRKIREAQGRRLSELSSQITKDSHDAESLEARAALEGRFGRFQQSADDYASAITIDPRNHWNYYYRGCLLAYLGDTRGYQEVCTAMVRQFAEDRDASILDRTAKTCVLLAGTVPFSQSADPLALADRAMKNAGKHDNPTWMSLGRGMALYRHGDYPATIASLQTAVKDSNDFLHSAARLYIAMAHYQLREVKQANTSLASAQKEIDAKLAHPDSVDIGNDNLENWLVCQIARREAEALIGSKPQ